MNVKKIKIFISDDMDRISLETDMPAPMLDQHLSVHFLIENGKGEEYCRKYFPNVPIHVVSEHNSEFTKSANQA